MKRNSSAETAKMTGRGYRWNGKENGVPRAWWIDVALDAMDAAERFLGDHVYGYEVEPLQRRSPPTTATRNGY